MLAVKLPSPDTGRLVDPDPRRFISLRIRQLLVNGESPLEFLLKQMQDTANSTQFRVYCAVQAAPYVHPRAAPEELEVTDPHQKFLDHVAGLKAQLMGRLASELPPTNEDPPPPGERDRDRDLTSAPAHRLPEKPAEVLSISDSRLPRSSLTKPSSQKSSSQIPSISSRRSPEKVTD